jgi:hypothetical protein
LCAKTQADLTNDDKIVTAFGIRRLGLVRVLTVVHLSLAVAGCRLRTTYDSEATKVCLSEATAGTIDLTVVNKRFSECCKRRGLEVADTNLQECGKLGLDAVLK